MGGRAQRLPPKEHRKNSVLALIRFVSLLFLCALFLLFSLLFFLLLLVSGVVCLVLFPKAGGGQKRRHQRQQQKEEGRTTTRITITRHKGKEQKGNGSKPERCSSCVLWGEGAAPSPPCPPPALGNLCGVMFKAQYKTDDARHKNKKKKEEQQREQQ